MILPPNAKIIVTGKNTANCGKKYKGRNGSEVGGIGIRVHADVRR